ncbi:MAG: transcriptional repressor LexA [bacterium]
MTVVLPKKKRELLKFLQEHIAKHNYAPTLTEIAKEFNLSSLATVHEHLTFLEDNGFIRRDHQRARGITMLDQHSSNDSKSLDASVLLPLVGTIAAGQPIEAIENRDTTISVPQEIAGRKNAYVLKVKGDSMIESLIADGDFVVVEKTDFAKDGDTVVALLEDGTATLKKFFKQKKYIRLQPANKKYRPIKASSVVIQGKVLGVLRTY